MVNICRFGIFTSKGRLPVKLLNSFTQANYLAGIPFQKEAAEIPAIPSFNGSGIVTARPAA
jgi:hypothetical protein